MMAASNDVLEEKVLRNSRDLGRAFSQIDKLDEANTEQRVRNTNFQNAMTELGASLEGMKETVEHIAAKVDDIDNRVTVIQTELATMKSQPVNIVKVLKFFSTWRGIVLIFGMVGMIMWGEDWSLAALKILRPG